MEEELKHVVRINGLKEEVDRAPRDKQPEVISSVRSSNNNDAGDDSTTRESDSHAPDSGMSPHAMHGTLGIDENGEELWKPKPLPAVS